MKKPKRVMHLDIETSSALDLFKVGVENYSREPTTKIMLLSAVYDDEPMPQQWDFTSGEEPPPSLVSDLLDPDVRKLAWNARFEYLLISRCWYLDLDLTQWWCVMAMARSLSFPGSLADAGEAIRLGTDKRKFADGKRLINKFCKPHPFSKKCPTGWFTAESAPEEWLRFKDYNRQDTIAEREIFHRIRPYLPLTQTPFERRVWLLDQKINSTGMPVDRAIVDGALKAHEGYQKEMFRIMSAITRLDNPNSVAQMRDWIEQQGVTMPSMTKEVVRDTLLLKDIPSDVRRVLEMWQQTSKASIKKFHAFRDGTSTAGRVHDTYAYYGAARTGRWAGSGVQPQNLPGSALGGDTLAEMQERLALAVQTVRQGDWKLLDLMYPSVTSALTSTIRCAITAPRGKRMVVADLSSIETVVIGWAAKCARILNLFREGKDAYKDYATFVFGVAYEEVTKQMRKWSKPPVLGCFAGETLVLSSAGWKHIASVTTSDLLWDGVEWVSHGGVIAQGVKETVDFMGVQATSDHLILTGDNTWSPVGACLKSDRLRLSALSQASLPLLRTASAPEGLAPTTNAVALAERSHAQQEPTSTGGLHGRALPARNSGQARACANTTASCLTTRFAPCGQGAMRRFLVAVTTLATSSFATTVRAAFTSAGAGLTGRISSATSRNSQAGTTLPSNSTAGTTAAGTGSGTCEWQLGKRTAATLAAPGWFGTRALLTALRSFTRASHLPTRTSQPSPEKYGRGSLRSGSSSTSREPAERETFDILNCGPRHRFTVLTDNGPVIAHNCGFMLGGDGLVAYAAGMGVNLAEMYLDSDWDNLPALESWEVDYTEEHRARAVGKRLVNVYRDAYVEVKALWYALKAASMKAVREQTTVECWPVIYEYRKPFLFCHLPSGRSLSYFDPKLEMRKHAKFGDIEALTYMGVHQKTRRWERLATHPGKLTENIVQAMARDLLAQGLINADAAGFEVIGHVHDEIITLTDVNSGLGKQQLIECMTDLPHWAKGMPVGAAGWEGNFYMKD